MSISTETSEARGGPEAGGPDAPTPMMAQYLSIRAEHPGYLLFYRMGDFYELFFSDAEIASEALGIVLTRRGKHLGRDIAMCGVPVHAANDYLNTLIRLGHRVAICEQVEDPAETRKRGPKAVVKRDVVRLVTPGTLLEDTELEPRTSNYLLAIAMLGQGAAGVALAWADISTGECFIAEVEPGALADALARVDPAEILLSEPAKALLGDRRLVPGPRLDQATVLPQRHFGNEAANAAIRTTYSDPAFDPSALSRAARSALGALLSYAADSQKGRLLRFKPPALEQAQAHMAIDAATRVSLDLLQTAKGSKPGSLLGEIDRCVTAPGARLLARRLAAPLTDPAAIDARLDAVAALIEAPLVAARMRAALKASPDAARALSRIVLERASPRDLRAIAEAVAAASEILARLEALGERPPELARIAALLDAAPRPCGAEIHAAIAENPPLVRAQGGFVKAGFDPALDAERALGSETRAVLASLQAQLIAETELRGLKIRHNGVLGYFIEVSAKEGARLLEPPHRERFAHRQTLASAMRFSTPELAELATRISLASDAALAIEERIFQRLCASVTGCADAVGRMAEGLAELDVALGLAACAAEGGWCRPVVDSTLAFAVEGGRHPVVEGVLRSAGASFVANDVDLSGRNGEGGALWLVTGPNMGGKSTFLRQNALIAILAQLGSYVPASSAHIGVVDRVFSRVGASDDIAHGRSTFMVEMVETAAILNRATRRSLVILDEIGRGTATFDGLSIAWASVEALHETTMCRALFATHFHELTALAKSLPRVSNHTMKVREWEGEVVFLHEVGAGAADRSYGIQVARLAGLPEPVLRRAREVLTVLEARSSGRPGAVLDDLPLFAHQPQPPSSAVPPEDPVHAMLDSIRPDDLTPRGAIELIYELKERRDAARRR